VENLEHVTELMGSKSNSNHFIHWRGEGTHQVHHLPPWSPGIRFLALTKERSRYYPQHFHLQRKVVSRQYSTQAKELRELSAIFQEGIVLLDEVDLMASVDGVFDASLAPIATNME
jgi:hypothetical protein